MNCENYLKLIDDLIEGELDESTADEVSLHILDCQNCTSQFEMLEREKEMYSHYLFEVEPPKNLLEKFQTALEAEEKTILAAQPAFRPALWISNLFNSLRLNPTLAMAVTLILLTFGFGLFTLLNEEKKQDTAVNPQPSLPGMQVSPVQKARPDALITPTTAEKKEVARAEKPKSELKPKVFEIKETVKERAEIKKIFKNQQNITKQTPKTVDPEESQLRQIQTLEVESAKQIEKVEQLLRSFRNARLIDGSEIYDVSYEQQQARRLLPNNIALRQKAENYGAFFTEDVLSRVEPYLLDIANLDANPSPDEVWEIKERVRNQNIIASLQGF